MTIDPEIYDDLIKRMDEGLQVIYRSTEALEARAWQLLGVATGLFALQLASLPEKYNNWVLTLALLVNLGVIYYLWIAIKAVTEPQDKHVSPNLDHFDEAYESFEGRPMKDYQEYVLKALLGVKASATTEEIIGAQSAALKSNKYKSDNLTEGYKRLTWLIATTVIGTILIRIVA